MNFQDEKALSLQPPEIKLNPGDAYSSQNRTWQGIPSLERTAAGRLWATWYSGGEGEGPDNYILLVTSSDDGHTWSEPRLVIDPPGKVRAHDPSIWLDPLGRLWLFWTQSYDWFDGRAGVWTIQTENPEVENPVWTEPKRLCHGNMLNKPVVLSTGEWLLPAALWASREPRLPELAYYRFSCVYCSTDQGQAWTLRGRADVPERGFDEHQLVERRDGSLWMLVRTRYGIGESFSNDSGFTWSPGQHSSIEGPGSRFFIRRLQSGRLLLVNHHHFQGRSHLTALLSEDDGQTWIEGLLLDKRFNVAYPDGVQASDGRIFIIYDHKRYSAKEILLAVFTEEDILAGKCVSKACRLKQLVNKAGKTI